MPIPDQGRDGFADLDDTDPMPEGIDETGFDGGGEDDLAAIAADPNRIRIVPDEMADEIAALQGGRPGGDDGEAFEGEVFDDDLGDLPLVARRRLQAEREAHRGAIAELGQTALNETARRIEAQKVSIASAKANLEGQRKAIEAELIQAEEEGDSAKKVAATSKLMKLTHQESDLEKAEAHNTAELERVKTVREAPVENPGLARFKQANSWYGRDPVATAAADAFARSIVAKGVQAGSEEFFRQVSAEAAKRFPEHRRGGQPAPRTFGDQRQQRPMSRGTGAVAAPGRQPGGAQRSSQVALTPAEKAQMRTFGLDPSKQDHQVEYARQIQSERARSRYQ